MATQIHDGEQNKPWHNNNPSDHSRCGWEEAEVEGWRTCHWKTKGGSSAWAQSVNKTSLWAKTRVGLNVKPSPFGLLLVCSKKQQKRKSQHYSRSLSRSPEKTLSLNLAAVISWIVISTFTQAYINSLVSVHLTVLVNIHSLQLSWGK